MLEMLLYQKKNYSTSFECGLVLIVVVGGAAARRRTVNAELILSKVADLCLGKVLTLIKAESGGISKQCCSKEPSASAKSPSF